MPLIRALNFVLVDRLDGDAAGLAAASKAVRARLGFAHRRTVRLGQALVERLWDGIRRFGLPLTERFLVMAHSRAPEREPPQVELTELSPAERARAREAGLRDDPGVGEDVLRQVLALGRRIEAAVPTRYLGVRSGREVVSSASLYLAAIRPRSRTSKPVSRTAGAGMRAP